MYSDYLRESRNQYRDAYNKVSETASALSTAISNLSNTISVQNTCYVVNDVGGGSNYLNHLLEKERGIYSNIVDNILPGLDSKIDSLNYRLDEALRAERAERERAEREARERESEY